MANDRNHADAISCKANRHSFHIFVDYHNDERVLCMFYFTHCLKMGTYFRNGFELNTAEQKLLRFVIRYLEANLGDQNYSNAISCKANRHTFHVFSDYHND